MRQEIPNAALRKTIRKRFYSTEPNVAMPCFGVNGNGFVSGRIDKPLD
jgi:hypothetical protein